MNFQSVHASETYTCSLGHTNSVKWFDIGCGKKRKKNGTVTRYPKTDCIMMNAPFSALPKLIVPFLTSIYERITIKFEKQAE